MGVGELPIPRGGVKSRTQSTCVKRELRQALSQADTQMANRVFCLRLRLLSKLFLQMESRGLEMAGAKGNPKGNPPPPAMAFLGATVTDFTIAVESVGSSNNAH